MIDEAELVPVHGFVLDVEHVHGLGFVLDVEFVLALVFGPVELVHGLALAQRWLA